MFTRPSVQKELHAVGFSALVTAGFALVEWFTPHPPPTWPTAFLPTILLLILHLLVLMCVWHVVAFCLAVWFAGLARKQNWAPKVCYLTGNLFIVIGIVMIGATEFVQVHRFRLMIALWGFILMCLRNRPGRLCRALAFPELADEEHRRILYPRRLAAK